ncbi:pseudouridine synthase [Roseisolibacter agri]|uniref:Pseudouridine synthase n=1 Tax=Roseisolibacter agri TaxID=2014610 RepID=A0AA37QHI3_9BACT|nr:pseudouridine synthase [Roseisolibacter agri]GLC26565.1 hypothetical protein rosag_30780 [Roseisolibacter agri]
MTPRETNGRDRGSRPAGKAGSRGAPSRGAKTAGAKGRGAPSRGAPSRGGRDERPARSARPSRDERPARGAFAPTEKPTRGERYDRPTRAPRAETSERDAWSAQPIRPERAPRPERGDAAAWKEREKAKKAPKRPIPRRPRPAEPAVDERAFESRPSSGRPARPLRPEATTRGGGDLPARRGGPQLPAGAPGRGPSRQARREQARGLDRPVPQHAPAREESRPTSRPARAIVRDVAPDGTRTVRPDVRREPAREPAREQTREQTRDTSRPQRPVRDRKPGSSSARKARPQSSEERAARALQKATPAVATGPMRLQRVLARAGLSSRRQAETLIAAGRVLVNGRPAQLGQTVDPAKDAVTLDGAPVKGPVAAQWLVLHKPAGSLTTRKDPQGRPTVFDLVPEIAGLTYVGRLDYMTEGVLLMTTDGDAAHRLTHPSHEVERTYVATVRGNAAAAVRQARKGVQLEDGVVHPTDVDSRPLGNRRYEFAITITEGRTREVRRVCEALGLEVERLVRVQFGPVKLGGLAPGSVRPLTVTEMKVIDGLVHAAPRDRRADYEDWGE